VRVGHYANVEDANRSARTLEKTLGWRMLVTVVSFAGREASPARAPATF
jgi:hypothetical protein